MSLLLLLAACGNPLGFGGDDIDDFEAADATGAFDTGRTMALQLTAGDHTIDVVHEGVIGPCGATWEISSGSPAEGRIEVTYTPTGGADDCEWRFDYTIPDVPSGTWTVAAAGDQATVVIQ